MTTIIKPPMSAYKAASITVNVTTPHGNILMESITHNTYGDMIVTKKAQALKSVHISSHQANPFAWILNRLEGARQWSLYFENSSWIGATKRTLSHEQLFDIKQALFDTEEYGLLDRILELQEAIEAKSPPAPYPEFLNAQKALLGYVVHDVMSHLGSTTPIKVQLQTWLDSVWCPDVSPSLDEWVYGSWGNQYNFSAVLNALRHRHATWTPDTPETYRLVNHPVISVTVPKQIVFIWEDLQSNLPNPIELAKCAKLHMDSDATLTKKWWSTLIPGTLDEHRNATESTVLIETPEHRISRIVWGTK